MTRILLSLLLALALGGCKTLEPAFEAFDKACIGGKLGDAQAAAVNEGPWLKRNGDARPVEAKDRILHWECSEAARAAEGR